MILSDVLYIPDFTCNLMSVSLFTQQFNCAVIFLPSFCVFQDLKSRKLIGTGKMRDGIYYFKLVKPPLVASAIKSTPISVWHQRLGHSSFNHLALIQVF